MSGEVGAGEFVEKLFVEAMDGIKMDVTIKIGKKKKRDRLVEVKLLTVEDKWKVVAKTKTLADIGKYAGVFVMPDMMRMQVKRCLRNKLKQMRKEEQTSIKISQRRIVSTKQVRRVVVYDPEI